MNSIKKILILSLIILSLTLTMGSIQAFDADNLNNDTITLDAENTEIDTHISSQSNDIEETEYSYIDLQNRITRAEENSIVYLTEDYKYDSSRDQAATTNRNMVDGVVISKNITILGTNNICIDGNSQARGLYIHSDCNVVLENITFKNAYSENNGAAIFLNSNSNLIIKNCVFKDNKVYNSNGGAIFAYQNTNVEIHGSQFITNQAVRVSNLEWEKFKRGMGSAIVVYIGSNLKLYDSTFKNNNGYLTTVLVVSYNDESYELSSLYMDNCLFENNIVNTNGVVYVDELGKAQILNSVFKNNKATNKGTGALILDAPKYASVQNCIFEDNTGIKGGAISINKYENNVGEVSVSGCTFNNNKGEYGGAIYSKQAKLTVTNSKFNKNTAIQGGAIYTDSGLFKLYNSNFNQNSASKIGGALYMNSENSVVDSTSFTQNSAKESGGAVYSKIESVSSSKCSYSSNFAPVGANVYGVYKAKVTPLSTYYGSVELKIELTSPWNMPLSHKFDVKLKGAHNHMVSGVKTNSKGVATVKVNKIVKPGIYTVSFGLDSGIIHITKKITVKKAPAKFHVKKLVIKHKSGKIFKAYLKNSKNKKPVFGAKVYLKFFTGKKYKTIKCTTDKNGAIKLKTKKLSVGKHIVKLSSADKNVKVSKKTTWIIIKK